MEKSTELNRHIGTSYNQYFTWNNNSAFYTIAPTYLFSFYNQNVRVWDMWNTGWVLNFHSIKKGILPTQFAGSLCQKVADLIYGEGVIFETTADKNVKNDNLEFINDIDKEIDIKGSIKDGILKSSQLGNSLLKLNSDGENLWVDAIAGNRFFVSLDSRGNVVKSRSYVNIYTNGVAKKGEQADSYGLVEERFYEEDEDGNRLTLNGKYIPKVVYKIYKLSARAEVFDSNPSDISIAFENLPRTVKRAFREEYGDLELDNPVDLGLRNLGVYLLKHTPYVTSIPNVKLGESCLAKVINYLPKYDAIDSEETADLRISRPKLFLPIGLSKGQTTNDEYESTYDVVVEKIPNKSDKEQMPVVFAPTPREEHFIRLKEDIIKKVCGNLGVATSSLFSDIQDSRGNVTAREISSENSNTALYVSNKRKLIMKPVNDMISDILAYYGKEENIKVAFTQAGASNKSVTVDNTVKLVKAGLEIEYQAIKENHPEWTDTQVEEEIAEIHKTQEPNDLVEVKKVDEVNEEETE
jgi:hypothetical protein